MKNFYSYLHKRKRFITKEEEQNLKYSDGKLIDSKNYAQFKLKKINIDEVNKDCHKIKNGKEKCEIRTSNITKSFKFPNDRYFKTINNRHLNNAKKLLGADRLKTIKLQPENRLILGLGSGSIFETSITLHHIYGFPYIPASAIKGVLRSYLIQILCEYNLEADSEAKVFNEEKDMCDIFGCNEETIFTKENNKTPIDSYYKKEYKEDKKKYEIKEKKGDVIFFDAYPITQPNLEEDIMNPHYPDYYNANTLPPADWQNPVPIPFLTVENTTFQFIIGLRKNAMDFDIDIAGYKGKVLEQLPEILKSALTQHGIGAKTAVGYGYMTET